MSRTPPSTAETLRQELLDFIDVLHLLSTARAGAESVDRTVGAFGHCAQFLEDLDTRMRDAAEERGAV